ncbi:transporter [Elysia marginata]|uniref:Transporter n=1 Tax=Elysia marginata TaxID=1093978 RepID=A0AAV4ITF6_9GAST|nr:transporter [Elysia marginata]
MSKDPTVTLSLERHRNKRTKRRASSGVLTQRSEPASPVDAKYYEGRTLDNPRHSGELTPVKPDTQEVNDQDEDEDEEERENWTGRLDFILSCVGFAVGLGNIWRFPYLCYSSGGGAFLIPYLTFMVVCALPLFFLETSYGQFSSLSPITVWRLCPLFKGIGYGMVIITGIVCIYYNVIISYNFYFLFAAMQRTLPWRRCDNWWNTPNCLGPGSSRNGSDTQGGSNSINGSNTPSGDRNGTDTQGTPASAEFWELNVLQRTKGLEDLGTLRAPLFGCLLLSWIVVFLCICKGVKSSGKVVYVTATFPYLVLSILLGKCITLPGATSGVWWYLVPQWEKLASFKVWGDAATQIFFSVGMAWGSLITLASYNKFSNNVYR